MSSNTNAPRLLAIVIVHRSGERWIGDNLQTEIRTLGCRLPIVIAEEGPHADLMAERGALALRTDQRLWTKSAIIAAMQEWVSDQSDDDSPIPLNVLIALLPDGFSFA